MNSLELCTLEEYHRNEPDRLYEHDICIEGIYLAMFALDSKKGRSLRFSAGVKELTEPDLDERRKLAFVQLDEDFKPASQMYWANIRYGILDFEGLVPPILSLVNNKSELSFVTGFLQDHRQGSELDQELARAAEEMLVPMQFHLGGR